MCRERAIKRDLTGGVPFDEVPDGGFLSGQLGDEELLLIRRGAEVFAIGAYCTHYHGALGQGLLVGETIRCPLHHACFSIRTGRMLNAPALDDIGCWRIERSGNRVFVREKLAPKLALASGDNQVWPKSIVIVGGGAAGLAAADTLRREGYDGEVTILSADDSPPCDRPNLSKDFLAGTAPDDWIPLRAPQYYASQRIELILNAQVTGIDPGRRRLSLADGRGFDFGALLLATGAEPVRLDIPGAAADRVAYLRTFSDSRALLAKAQGARRVVVVGSSFIGLEVAASLRARNIDVHVVSQDKVPMERVMGIEVGRFIQSVHESHGVQFHLRTSVSRMNGSQITLADGGLLEADFVVLGVGVHPATKLAADAGLQCDRGVRVDEYLQSSIPGIFAAGDIARWPDPHTGTDIRVEHWVVAQRQGQVAARNMLGRGEKFRAVPFFWSQHYDVTINYVGHAEQWDDLGIEGSLAARDCAVLYRLGGRILAVATVCRDQESLRSELEMEAAAG